MTSATPPITRRACNPLLWWAPPVEVSKLGEAKYHLNAIQQDLYEIDGVVGLTTAPLSFWLSPTVRNYRLLIRIGYDLTAAGTTGIDVAQTLLGPLTGGALSSDGQGINADDIQRARVYSQAPRRAWRTRWPPINISINPRCLRN